LFNSLYFIRLQRQCLSKAVLLGIVFFTYPLICTATLQLHPDTTYSPAAAVPQENYRDFYRHSIAWGANFVEGDITRGRDEGELMISTAYARNLSRNASIEAALHYVGFARYRQFQGRFTDDTARYISSAWIGDMTIFAAPFNGVLERLRFGIGPTLRWYGSIIANQRQRFYVSPQGDTTRFPATSNIQYSENILIGVHGIIEYVIPLQSNHGIEIVVRSQLHLMLPPSHYIGSGGEPNNFGSLGSASIGAFLRFSW
jgi:hypothetical protein